MSSIIIIYSTTDGHTREICLRLLRVIEQQGEQVALIDIEDMSSVDLTGFDKIVIGASIRYGKHDRKVYEFIERKRQLLEDKPNVFSLSTWLHASRQKDSRILIPI